MEIVLSFLQGSLCNIPNYRSHGELSTDVHRYGSLRRVNENEVNIASANDILFNFKYSKVTI